MKLACPRMERCASARVGMALAGILLVPGLATLWTAWENFNVRAA
jgi:hypothetical protein